MVSRELLRSVVVQQKGRIEKSGDFIQRTVLAEVLKAFDDNRVLIITGIRRCGKSTLLKQVMDTRTRFCYVNFEDERLLKFNAEEFEDLNEVLIEVYGAPDIYFFDEVQNVDKFETFVRRLQDSGKKVMITGSNASLLSREFGTRLTGRYRLFELYPFSFTEFLRSRKNTIGKDSPYIPEYSTSAPSPGRPDPEAAFAAADERANAGDPHGAAALYVQAAEACLSMGASRSAVDECLRALGGAPGDTEVHLELARIHVATGHAERAADTLDLLERLLTLDADADGLARVDAFRRDTAPALTTGWRASSGPASAARGTASAPPGSSSAPPAGQP